MKKTIIFSLIAGVMLTACNKDWLTVDPVVNQTVETFYKTEDDVNKAVISTYDPLQWNATNFWGFEYHNFAMISNVLSDDCWSGGGAAGDRVGYLAAERGVANPAAPDFYALYTTNFRGVNRANMVTSRMDAVEEISDEAKSQFLGEAKFLRALYYFRLVRMWEKIPLVTQEMSLDELTSLPQAEPQDVYNQIASDLLDAYNTLPPSYSGGDLGRATKWAAGGLLLRTFLYFDGYSGGTLTAGDVVINKAKAIEIADDIILKSGHRLLLSVDSLFKSSNENNIESLFEVQFTEGSQWGDWQNMMGQSGNMTVNFYGMRGVSEDAENDDGWSYATVTQELSDEFEAGDPRRGLSILAPEENKIAYTPAYQNTGYFVGKYTPMKSNRGTAGEKRFNYNNNEVILRFADVLLMAAELNLEVNNGKALDYLNEVRKRAMGEDAKLGAIDLDAVYHERRVELAGEGVRYWDLLRRGLDYTKTMIDGTTINTDEGIKNGFTSTFNMASKGLMPIPQNELDLSSAGWKQNDGY